MPRKSTELAIGSSSRSTSKRPAPETPNRQSKRAKAAARKSYVEPATDSDEADDGDKKSVPSHDDYDDEDAVASDYEDHSDKQLTSESEPEAPASEDDTKPKNATTRGRPAQSKALPVHMKHADDTDLWKSGAKLTPGTQIIIKKPKARDAGDTPYSDGTIHPNTM